MSNDYYRQLRQFNACQDAWERQLPPEYYEDDDEEEDEVDPGYDGILGEG